jgi:phosphate transport system protein
MEHTVKAFDADLAELSAEVARLGALASTEVADAVKALGDRNGQLALEVVERDRNLDALQLEIEEKSVRLVALRQPVAIDLRRAMAAMKMAANLERCGDLAKNIAKRALAVGDTELPAPLMRPIERMGRLVLGRLETALTAYAEDDLVRATEVWTRDREVDEAYESVFRELLTYMMGDARLIAACSHLLFVAKNLERIGDHATNIAEIVHYAMTGDQLTARPKIETVEP